jgi:ribosomal protein L40E
MTEFGKTICPECGAGNGLGAPHCVACGLTLIRPGMAARPIDDDEEDEAPRRPLKKPARPADERVQKDPSRPTKKPAAKRPIDEDEEDEAPRRSSKKPVSRRDDDADAAQDEPQSMRDNTLLNMLFPVGVSIWAMLSNYLGVGGLLLTAFGFALAYSMDIKIAGVIMPIAGGLFCLLAIPVGGLSFILRPKKRTYGGVTGYMRAIIGILSGLAGVVAAPVAMWWLSQNF